MPSFADDHSYLLELSNVIERQYSFEYTFGSIDSEVASYELWEEFIDGAIPEKEEVVSTPQNWYSQYWYNCAQKHLCADLDGYEFQEICDYTFYDDETNYTGHFLDFY